MSVTALSIVTDAFETLQVFQPGDSLPAADADSGFRTFNQMLGGLSQQGLTMPAVARVVTPLVAGKGGPSSPYTIGTGANISTQRPASQAHVLGAGLLLNTPVPAVELPRTVITDDAYQRIPTKELAGSLFSWVWYNPTFVTAGFGTIQLYPVPDNTTNSLVLYLQQALAAFADLTTTYELPDGYEQMLVCNLARALAKPYGVPVDADLTNDATETLRLIKRANFKMVDLPNDFTGRRGGYDITTGQ